MFRFGRNQRIIPKIILLTLLIGLVVPIAANIRFYSYVQQFCKARRVSVRLENMTLEKNEDGTFTFNIILESRRNNWEPVTVLGYAAAGQAAARTELNLKTIVVTVIIPKDDNMILMTTADIGLVNQLRAGKIKAHEFMRSLNWNN